MRQAKKKQKQAELDEFMSAVRTGDMSAVRQTPLYRRMADSCDTVEESMAMDGAWKRTSAYIAWVIRNTQ